MDFEGSDMGLDGSENTSGNLCLTTNKILCRALWGNFRYYSDRGVFAKRIEASFAALKQDETLNSDREMESTRLFDIQNQTVRRSHDYLVKADEQPW